MFVVRRYEQALPPTCQTGQNTSNTGTKYTVNTSLLVLENYMSKFGKIPHSEHKI